MERCAGAWEKESIGRRSGSCGEGWKQPGEVWLYGLLD